MCCVFKKCFMKLKTESKADWSFVDLVCVSAVWVTAFRNCVTRKDFVEAAEKHCNRNVFGAIRVNQATDLFLHSFIHYCTAHTLLSFVVAGRYGWDVFPSFSDPGQPFSATVRTYRVHIEISISSVLRTYVTLEHKTSHKGQFFEMRLIHHLKAE